MQTANPQHNRAVPPTGSQMQEMFELSSWLGDVFAPVEAPIHHLPPMSDIDIRPEMLLSSPLEGMDHEVDIITSSPTISLDCLDLVHPVSPTPSPSASTSSITATLPTTDAFQLTQTPLSAPPAKRKRSNSTHLVSDSSDNEDASQRIQKRQRRAQHTAKPAKVVSPPAAVKPKQKSAAVTKAAAPNNTKVKTADIATKKQIRREKNREHAKKSRSKKRDFNIALEESVMALREENKKLRELVYSRFGEAKAKTMVQERIRTPEDKMIEALKKPANKVLSKSVIHYLESLRHDIKLNSTR